MQPNVGEYVVTSGTVAPPDESRCIRRASSSARSTSVNEESAFKSVNVHPIANLHNLDIVEVLTSAAGSRAANLSRAVIALPRGAGCVHDGVRRTARLDGGGR